jgi:hypothetical protein
MNATSLPSGEKTTVPVRSLMKRIRFPSAWAVPPRR